MLSKKIKMSPEIEVVLTNVPDREQIVLTTLAVDNEQRIVPSGFSLGSEARFVLARYLPSGLLDPDFN